MASLDPDPQPADEYNECMAQIVILGVCIILALIIALIVIWVPA